MENNKNNNGNSGAKFPLPPKKKSKKSAVGRWIKVVWIGFFAVIFGVTALFFAVSQGFIGDMPDVKELDDPDIYVASQIISSDGQVLGKFEKEKTKPVTYKELPPYLVYALQAKEDERFKEHSGIDLKSVARAIAYGGKEVEVLQFLNNWQNYYLLVRPLRIDFKEHFKSLESGV